MFPRHTLHKTRILVVRNYAGGDCHGAIDICHTPLEDRAKNRDHALTRDGCVRVSLRLGSGLTSAWSNKCMCASRADSRAD